MTVVELFPRSPADDERRLAEFGLSSSDFHTAFSAGLSRAANRTRLAPPTAAGTDVFNDSFEALATILVSRGWRQTLVLGQPRVIHPGGLLQMALSSARDVGDTRPRVAPKTRHKGPATQASLDLPASNGQVAFDLPEFAEVQPLPSTLAEAPFWFVLYQRDSSRLSLALGRPSGMDASGRVVAWSDTIAIMPFPGAGDLTVFVSADGGDGGIDVNVEPRT